MKRWFWFFLSCSDDSLKFWIDLYNMADLEPEANAALEALESFLNEDF
jgi:hypothetical protein